MASPAFWKVTQPQRAVDFVVAYVQRTSGGPGASVESKAIALRQSAQALYEAAAPRVTAEMASDHLSLMVLFVEPPLSA